MTIKWYGKIITTAMNISYTKLSFLDEKIRNESSKRGSTNSAASISSNAAVPTAAEI